MIAVFNYKIRTSSFLVPSDIKNICTSVSHIIYLLISKSLPRGVGLGTSNFIFTFFIYKNVDIIDKNQWLNFNMSIVFY